MYFLGFILFSTIHISFLKFYVTLCYDLVPAVGLSIDARLRKGGGKARRREGRQEEKEEKKEEEEKKKEGKEEEVVY